MSGDPSIEDESIYFPGVMVLAKMKGYSPWPGLIVESASLSDIVLSAKPPKKQVWPVRFFNDNHHMWASINELQVLTKEAVSKYLSSARAKKDKKMLVEAYRYALREPTLDDLAAEDDAILQARTEKAATKKTKKQPVEVIESNGSNKSKTSKATAATAKTTINENDEPSATKKRKSAGEVESTSVPAESKKSKHNISKPVVPSKKKQPTSTSVASTVKVNAASSTVTPSSKELSKNSEARGKVCFLIRHKLQKGFLGKEPPQESDMPNLSELLRKLEEIPNLELSVIRQTKVNKVLKAILNIPVKDIPLESKFDFHGRSLKLLDKWSNMVGEGDFTNSKTNSLTSAKGDAKVTVDDSHKKENKDYSHVKKESKDELKDVPNDGSKDKLIVESKDQFKDKQKDEAEENSKELKDEPKEGLTQNPGETSAGLEDHKSKTDDIPKPTDKTNVEPLSLSENRLNDEKSSELVASQS